MITQDSAKDSQKPIPCRSKAGKIRNIGSEGSTNQNVDSECAATRSKSEVSFHNQIIPKIEISGSDATSPPSEGLRFAISDTIMTIMPDSVDLITR